jgi:MgtE intracellular N domain
VSALAARAEILKLERLLAKEPGELEFLEPVSAEDLRELRDRATDVLFDGDRHVLQRLAAAAGKIPIGLVATIGRHAFGPLLCARVTGLLEPDRAAEVAEHLPAEFQADIAQHLDPRRATAVIARIPTEQVVQVAAELDARGEHVAMGRFVAHLSDEALVGCFGVLDDASVLRTAFVLEGKERLDRVVELLPEGRLEGVIRAAAGEDLWPEALDLIGHLAEERQVEVAQLTANQTKGLLDGLVRSAQKNDLWDLVLPLVARMELEDRRRLAGLRSVHSAKVLKAIVTTAAAHGLWDAFLPLIPLLPPDPRAKVMQLVADIAAGMEPSELRRILEDAASPS